MTAIRLAGPGPASGPLFGFGTALRGTCISIMGRMSSGCLWVMGFTATVVLVVVKPSL